MFICKPALQYESSMQKFMTAANLIYKIYQCWLKFNNLEIFYFDFSREQSKFDYLEQVNNLTTFILFVQKALKDQNIGIVQDSLTDLWLILILILKNKISLSFLQPKHVKPLCTLQFQTQIIIDSFEESQVFPSKKVGVRKGKLN